MFMRTVVVDIVVEDFDVTGVSRTQRIILKKMTRDKKVTNLWGGGGGWRQFSLTKQRYTDDKRFTVLGKM
jgi:hypothetical protein